MSVSQRPTPISIPKLLKAEPTPPINHVEKRQRNQQQQDGQGDNIVHVTVTASGTVVYTYTATSYSYIPTYSTITDNNSTNNNSNSSSSAGQGGSISSSGPNIGAIVGGVVGGIAFIALIGLAFFFIKRSQKKKTTNFENEHKIENGPRPFVAPFHQDDPEGGYYEDMVSYPGTHYNTPGATTTDSLSSGNMAASSQQYIYQVPNEYPQERHVPHLKEHEPPHLKD